MGSGQFSAFECEKDMHAPVAKWLARQGCDVKSEFYLPWGVCDLVGVEFDNDKLIARLANNQKYSLGSILNVLIFDALPDVESRTSISLSRLAHRLNSWCDKTNIEQSLQLLQLRGFVLRANNGGFQRLNGWLPLQRRIIAVELKIDRVSVAHFQAKAHRSFADETYVALPEQRAEKLIDTNKRQFFEDTGVGILGVAGNGCQCLLRSVNKSHPVNAVFQAHIAERFWTTILRCNGA